MKNGKRRSQEIFDNNPRIQEQLRNVKTISIEEFCQNDLNEGLIRTINVEDSLRILDGLFRGYSCRPENHKNGILITFSSKLHGNDCVDVSDLCYIIDALNNLGYYPDRYVLSDDLINYCKFDKNFIFDVVKNYPGKLVYIIFAQKYSPSIEHNKIPDVLYHLADGSNESKILKNGLVPKTKNKIENHPDRIYLCKTTECIKKLIGHKLFQRKSTSNFFSLFKVKPKELHDIELFIDQSHKDAFYSYRNVPPYCLELLQQIPKPQ